MLIAEQATCEILVLVTIWSQWVGDPSGGGDIIDNQTICRCSPLEFEVVSRT
jgi:hypothetical protein